MVGLGVGLAFKIDAEGAVEAFTPVTPAATIPWVILSAGVDTTCSLKLSAAIAESALI